MTTDGMTDRWCDWLVRGRDAGDAEVRRRSLSKLAAIRDQVLEGGRIAPGEAVLDVGTGEGLLGIGALDRVGPDGRVVFTDVSEALLDRARAAVEAIGAAAQAEFLVAPAETLAGVADRNVDVVVLRSVLIYVADRASAFQTFARVLRPGGRLSLFEPVASFFAGPVAEARSGDYFGWDLSAVAALADAVRARYRSVAGPNDPMLTLEVPELVAHAEAAGFNAITARLTATSLPAPPGDETAITAVLHGRPNPNLPSAAELAEETLGPYAAAQFLAALASAVRTGGGRARHSVVHLTSDWAGA
jgi:arsenite methyltransferase